MPAANSIIATLAIESARVRNMRNGSKGSVERRSMTMKAASSGHQERLRRCPAHVLGLVKGEDQQQRAVGRGHHRFPEDTAACSASGRDDAVGVSRDPRPYSPVTGTDHRAGLYGTPETHERREVVHMQVERQLRVRLRDGAQAPRSERCDATSRRSCAACQGRRETGVMLRQSRGPTVLGRASRSNSL